MRLTKIVCTFGPAVATSNDCRSLIRSGMNVARLNFSHGDHATHLATLQRIREISNAEGSDTALMLDTKGPEIRTGDVVEPISITKGEKVLFTHDRNVTYKGTVVHVNYAAFGADAKNAEAILIDNGELSFQFVQKTKQGVLLQAEQHGSIGSKRHINLPGADVSLPSMTDRDWKDIAFGVEHNVDYVALSFVRTAKDIDDVRAFLKKKKSDMHIIAKIETRLSVQNIESIIHASDGIMIARGDLGAEMPFEKIPAVQDMIVRACRKAGKPVIVATQMLESMIKNPMPTRAEVTDVAHAATVRTDATMLSGETAVGAYPLKAVKAMTHILEETESHLPECHLEHEADPSDDTAVRAQATVTMAHASDARAIVVLCNTGRTAACMSTWRPKVPVFALSDSPVLRRKLQLFFGIQPVALTMEAESERNAERALALLTKQKYLRKGDKAVVLSRAEMRKGSLVNVSLRTVS